MALTKTSINVDKGSGANVVYGEVGQSVVLDPGQTSNAITSIRWSYGSNLAVVWFGQDVTYFSNFIDRCGFNKATGRLTISHLKLEDSGNYTYEINGVTHTINLQVIEPVPQPMVAVECNKERTVCNLTCEIDHDAECGPVHCEWISGDRELSTDCQLNLPAEYNDFSFYCMVENPVSNSSSNEMRNPFLRATSEPVTSMYCNVSEENYLVPVIIVVMVILILLLVCIMYRRGVFTQLRRSWVNYQKTKQTRDDDDDDALNPRQANLSLC